MPASRAAVAVTDRYRQQLTALRAHAERSTLAAWQSINLDDLDGSHARFAAITAVQLVALQRAGQRLTHGYTAAFLSSELRKPVTPLLAASPLIGTARDGKPLAASLDPPLWTVKKAIGAGAALGTALRLGQDRAVRNAGENVAYVARETLADTIQADDRIIGWRRVTGGGCGACLAAATGAIQADDEVLDVHPACQCSKEPVVAHVRETVHRPTGEQMFHAMSREAQDGLFAGSGGAEKADLLRAGEVPFHALIEHQHMAAIPDGITEAPLAALTATK